MRSTVATALCFFVLNHISAAADATYQETTKITGGSITSMMKFAGAFSKDARKLGQPIVTTVAIKGNKMMRSTDNQIQITDLDAQTITHIDKLKHEYSVVTFQQIKEAAQRAMEKAKTEQAKAPTQPANPDPAKDPNVQLNFDAHVRKTGAVKQVSGLDTSEIILTLAVNGTDKTSGQQGAMAVTNDMWMAPDVPAYAAVREFDKKLAVEMGAMLAPGPDLTALAHAAQTSDALKAMAKEMSQIQGVPVLQVMRMGMTTNGQPLPAASEAPLPPDVAGPSLADAIGGSVTKTATDTAQQTAAQETAQRVRGPLGSNLGSAIGGLGGFGGLSGFGHKKKQPQQPAAQEPAPTTTTASTAQAAGTPPASAVLIESVTELGSFAETVDPAVMEIPAGFKQVAAPESKI